MWPDRIGPLAFESEALPTALCGPASAYIAYKKFNPPPQCKSRSDAPATILIYCTARLPFCIVCNQHFTVKHILIDCIDFLQTRNKYYRANDLPQLFQDVPVDNILSFLKEINIFNKI